MKAVPSPVLSARQLSKRYGAAIAVDRADLSLHSGRILCLLGPSGCGKSSLLRLIAGLEQPDGGELRTRDRLLFGAGAFVPPEKRGIGLVFQDFALFPHLTAAENIAFGLRHLPAPERRRRSVELLERFNLAHRADAWPHTLSGGEQQRIAIARALAPEPVALLLDEPFSGLDGELRAQVRDRIVSGLRESDSAIMIVTHDPEEAMLVGDELALMSEGRIVQCGPPMNCYNQPASIGAAALLGRVNALSGTVAGGIAHCLIGAVPAPHVGDGPAAVLVRPEVLAIAEAGTECVVADVKFGGAYFEVELSAGDQRLVMRTAGQPPTVGDRVMVAVAGQPWVIESGR
ncbi:MAG TPA: ABC transporter ATP-binding protein [Sphingomicrobium sp.]|nr:ABC transporter ATP-binding protein [Sphingomicrobium sp.]